MRTLHFTILLALLFAGCSFYRHSEVTLHGADALKYGSMNQAMYTSTYNINFLKGECNE